jgi:hypothetical protein
MKPKPRIYTVTGKLVMFEEMTAPWTYLTIPLNKVPDVDPGGWGAIPVEVTVGKTTWRTSMFPLPGAKEYFLPMKKPVLKKEDLKLGDEITAEYFTTRSNL